jgi:hypothetical protein
VPVAGEFSSSVDARQLSIAEIWSDDEGGNASGAAFSRSMTVGGLAG